MAEQIEDFINPLIAFYRQRKRTYFFLQWNTALGKWLKYNGDQQVFTLHVSSTQQNGYCNVSYVIRGRVTRIRIECKGFFLRSGNTIVPIIEHVTLPASLIGREFTATAPVDNDEYRIPQLLWRVQQPAPVLVAPPRQQMPMKRKESIPRRIAWLIAEDAQKQGDTCAITMEEISPMTAAVTTCFHVFNGDALAEWVARHTNASKIPCPVCRKDFSMTRSYEDEPPPLVLDDVYTYENPITV
jgi:hypothetical protein